jgi:hypothetical protein
MPPSSKAFAPAASTHVSDVGPAHDNRRRRNVAAACLLVMAALIQCGGVGITMNIDERFGDVWLPFAFCFPLAASVASLLLGDRRKLWVKLNYLLLGWWALVSIVGLIFFAFFPSPG